MSVTHCIKADLASKPAEGITTARPIKVVQTGPGEWIGRLTCFVLSSGLTARLQAPLSLGGTNPQTSS